MRGLLSILVLMAGLTATAKAQTAIVETVDIIAFGLYRTQDSERVRSDDTAIGHMTLVSKYELVTKTQTICATLGVSFGVEFVVAGKPMGAAVSLDNVTVFPPQGVVHPNGKKFQLSKFTSQPTIGGTNYRSYTFDEPWEIALGPWVFEFHHQGRKVGEQRFTVIPCQAVS